MAGGRKRASEACNFCRRRKIKCNGAHPTCVNCQIYDQDCVYEPVGENDKEIGRRRHRAAKRKQSVPVRHSDTRLPSDGARGSRSRSRSSSLGRQHHDQDSEPDFPAQESIKRPATRAATRAATRTTSTPSRSSSSRSTPAAVEGRVARILMSANGVSSYHSRTSTLYDDNALERTSDHNSLARPPVSEEWIERGLVAEAARQRQLEELNLRRGKLDFDGVDPELGMHLLAIHWNRQHHSFLSTYRPAFMRDMACGGPYFSKLLLNAIFFGAAKFSPRLQLRKDPDDVRTAGWMFRGRVRELLGSALDRSSITTIQALLQMTTSLFALGDERSAAWLYAGLAFRMIIDLGMHVDLSRTGVCLSDEDLEIRRRVFWAAFVIDKMQSLYQGRPASLRDTDVLVPIKFLDTYEELEYWQPFAYSARTSDYPGSPAHSVSTFAALCKLSLVMSDILSSIYTERSVDQTPATLSRTLETLQCKLDGWKRALPEHIQLDKTGPDDLTAFPAPHVFSLHAMHNVLVILLHRPFLAEGHLFSTSRSMLVDSFMKCAIAASNICNILRAYHRAFSIRHAPYLMSYATYVAATIIVRIAAKRRAESSVHSNLATCLAVFKENQETNFAVRKAAMVIETLMKRLGVVVDEVPANILSLHVVDTPPMASSVDVRHHTGRSSSDGAGADAGSGAAPSLGPLRPGAPAHHELSFPPQPSGPDLGSFPQATAAANGIACPSNSEWFDIEGIIQSFLQDASSGPSRPLASFEHARGIQAAAQPEPRSYQNLFGLAAAAAAETASPSPVSLSVPAPVDSVSSFPPSAPWGQALRDGQMTSAFAPIDDDPLFGFNNTFPFAMNGGSFPA
ncbi:hypothetical protein E4U42_008044 [Claviceps africana]|uniref:Zn(2)-C6 fungal-type domain-containing protein n=1 Tax=Claviceps africana TaxID=83212 RepID=A0A8K0NIL4_9HYPO|nr:hypothetical protein E4U42_008044 [Claviceps africana]